MRVALGLDTSNYTTSAAVCRDDWSGCNESLLLSVPHGSLGLRQSEALFQHVRRIPDRIAALKGQGLLKELAVVGASTAPRSAEGSYMPCFLAGESQGKVLADTMNLPFFSCSHQEGHIAAVCWNAGKLELLEQPILAWHLSGGTTELVFVEPRIGRSAITIIGGTTDISAGQLIDRTGKRLGLLFPAGKELDRIASISDTQDRFQVKIQELHFSLSGIENQVQKRIENGVPPEDVARFTLNTIASTIDRTTRKAHEMYPGIPVLCSGGVSSNTLLRESLKDAVFAQPQFSADNAMGVAVLAMRALERGIVK